MVFQLSLGTAAVAVGREEFLLPSTVSPQSGRGNREKQLEYLTGWDGKREPNGKLNVLQVGTCQQLMSFTS